MNKFRSAIQSGKAASSDAVLMPVKRRGGSDGDDLASVGITREAQRTADHRDEDRHRLAQESATIRFHGKDHAVDLVNLSGGGAMVGTAIRPRLWDRVDLILGEGAGIECAVRWIRDDRIGLEFAHETCIDCPPEQLDALLLEVIRRSFPETKSRAPVPTPVAPVAAVEAPAERGKQSRRGDHRHPLIWSGQILWQHDSHTVRLRNVSTTGALVDCPIAVPPGSELMLDLGDNGQYFATVSWSRGGQAGLVFASPFDLSALAGVRPEVAPSRWERPTFLDLPTTQSSPWAPEWERRPMEELRADLEGFLKR